MSAASGSRVSRLVGVFAIAALAACGPTQNGHPGNGNGGDGGGTGTGTGTGTDDPDGGGSGTGTHPDAPACASTPHKAETAPLDMFIMLDQSGSMQGAKWTAVTGAIKTFVQQPGLTGFNVGLQYFGLSGGGSSCPTTCNQDADCGAGNLCLSNMCLCLGGLGDSCTAADYAKAEVEIAPLPGVASAIVSSLGAHSPNTGTPTSAALQGAIDHAKAWGTSHPGDVVIDVLATDGDPEECDTTLADINAIAAAGLNGTPKVLTYVIGVGSSLTNLNGIAAAGGTTSAYIVDTNANAGQQFLDALNAIRGTALGCNYAIPLPTSGVPDFNNVTVTYHPTSGTAKTIPHVGSMSMCPASGDGWYYDNNSAPMSIILCKPTCTAVTADTTGEVDIYTPCTVVVN
jgi:hypothetical protein